MTKFIRLTIYSYLEDNELICKITKLSKAERTNLMDSWIIYNGKGTSYELDNLLN